jgi:hypothetical protein
MKLKPFALILVLLALFAVSDRALTSAETGSAHSAVATAALPSTNPPVFTATLTCPDMCCDQICSCVRHGRWTTSGCVYQLSCTCS